MRKVIFLTALLSTLFSFNLLAQDVDPAVTKADAPATVWDEGRVYLKGTYGLFRKIAKLDPSLASMPELQAVAEDFRSGSYWSAEAGVRVGARQYLGLTHSRLSQSGNFVVTITGNSGTARVPGTVSEKIAYTGLNYGYHFPLGAAQRVMFNTKAGLGLWGYNSKLDFAGTTDETKESGLGYQVAAGLEVRLAKPISWFFDLELLTGNVKIEQTEENLSQFRIGTGLLFRF